MNSQIEHITILIIDDDPNKTTTLESIIADCGAEIIKCTSGMDGLRWLLNNEPAVILLDVNMPVMNGFETAAMIRKRKRSEHTPIIFITAYSTDAKEVSAGYSFGAVDYLFTPVVPQILKSKVDVFIDLFRMNLQMKNHLAIIQKANLDIQELNKSLVEKSDSLAELNKELEAFTSTVSHDLRAPLRHISSFLELLKKRLTNMDEKSVKFMNTISESAVRMDTLITDLLAFAKIGKVEFRKFEVDCNWMVNEIIDEFKIEFEHRKIVWKIADMPKIFADRNLLKQVWANLISNAVKYTSTRDEAIIEIKYERLKEHHQFTIKDNGAGFKMEYIDRLFGVFQRLHTQTEFPGTGIGLANVKKIVSKHGGEVWAKSEINNGAEFGFSIPIVNGK